MKSWLLDTGPLVAYLDRDDAEHERVVSCLGQFSGQLHTTSAVIVEAMHFVSADPEGPRRLATFVKESTLLVHPCTQPLQLNQAVTLMKKYADIPMDFADATLVLLSEELKVAEIVTLDRRGFSSYRTAQRKPFHLVLTS